MGKKSATVYFNSTQFAHVTQPTARNVNLQKNANEEGKLGSTNVQI